MLPQTPMREKIKLSKFNVCNDNCKGLVNIDIKY